MYYLGIRYTKEIDLHACLTKLKLLRWLATSSTDSSDIHHDIGHESVLDAPGFQRTDKKSILSCVLNFHSLFQN